MSAGGAGYTAGTWTNKAVSVLFACTDTLGGAVLAPATNPRVLTTEGANQSVSATCTDISGKSASATVSGINIDLTPPVITITTPANGASYTLGASLTASYSCTDTISPVTSCTGPVASGGTLTLSTAGPGSFAVSSSNAAGNATTAASSYTVVAPPQFTFVGYLTPLKTAGTYSGTAKLGSAVPVKFQILDGSRVAVSNIAAVASIRSIFTGRPTGGTCPISLAGTSTVLYAPTTGATGGSTFRIDTGNTFILNWDSTSVAPLGAGCYTVVTELAPAYGGLVRSTSIQLTR